MVVLAGNPSLEELRQEEFQFKGNLSYVEKGGKGKERGFKKNGSEWKGGMVRESVREEERKLSPGPLAIMRIH